MNDLWKTTLQVMAMFLLVGVMIVVFGPILLWIAIEWSYMLGLVTEEIQ